MSVINNNAKELVEGYDVCIVGSGPAGMTLCAELVGSGKKVCVLESGVKIKSHFADALRKVENIGEIKIREDSREKVFGGTSATWGGGAAPLDDVDFSTREFMQNKIGWPYGLDELSKYYKKAEDYGFPSYDSFDPSKHSEIKNETDKAILDINLDKKVFIAMDPPWNFAHKLGHIFDNKNVDLFLDATVTEIKISQENLVSHLNVVSSGGFKWKIKSKVFVVAAGGIESVRLLLASSVGNKYGQVGKYIMNHPKNSFGMIKLNKPVYKLPFFFGYHYKGFAGFAGLKLSSSEQLNKGVLNSYVRLEPIFPWSDNIGVWSFLTVVKKMRTLVNFWKKKQKKIVHLRDYNETPDDDGNKKFSLVKALVDIVLNSKSIAHYIFHRLFPNVKVPITYMRLRNFMEMEPREENRMALSNKLDINGQRVALVNLNTSDLDRRSLIQIHKDLKKEIELSGVGVLIGDLEKEKNWPITLDASHHLGGTRMGTDARYSVVDENLKVHDVYNLYVCSASVFPTSGCANPTYTICALAIRLGYELNKKQ